MKKYLILVLVALMLLSGMQIVQRQKALSSKLVRLHVVANSNQETDQQIKLQVRDAVLQQVQNLTAGCQEKEETVVILQENLSALQQTAQRALQQAGSSDTAHVSLCQERFPTRLYETFSLPAGEYTSLRVELGQAKGRNWWCVVFPTLCTAAQTQDMQAIAAAAGFDDGEIAMITSDQTQYQMEFKLLEGLEKLKALFISE